MLSSGGHCSELNDERAEILADRTVLSNETSEQCELYSGKDDICAHEVLQDGEPDSDSSEVQNRMMWKVSHWLTRSL